MAGLSRRRTTIATTDGTGTCDDLGNPDAGGDDPQRQHTKAAEEAVDAGNHQHSKNLDDPVRDVHPPYDRLPCRVQA